MTFEYTDNESRLWSIEIPVDRFNLLSKHIIDRVREGKGHPVNTEDLVNELGGTPKGQAEIRYVLSYLVGRTSDAELYEVDGYLTEN